MRLDENQKPCPATLGEYRKFCAAIGGEDCFAVKFLDEKISESPNGPDEIVIAPDSQMRVLLYPMIMGGDIGELPKGAL